MNKMYELAEFLGVGKRDYEMFNTKEKVRAFAKGFIEATSEEMERLRIARARSRISDNYRIKIKG